MYDPKPHNPSIEPIPLQTPEVASESLVEQLVTLETMGETLASQIRSKVAAYQKDIDAAIASTASLATRMKAEADMTNGTSRQSGDRYIQIVRKSFIRLSWSDLRIDFSNDLQSEKKQTTTLQFPSIGLFSEQRDTEHALAILEALDAGIPILAQDLDFLEDQIEKKIAALANAAKAHIPFGKGDDLKNHVLEAQHEYATEVTSVKANIKTFEEYVSQISALIKQGNALPKEIRKLLRQITEEAVPVYAKILQKISEQRNR